MSINLSEGVSLGLSVFIWDPILLLDKIFSGGCRCLPVIKYDHHHIELQCHIVFLIFKPVYDLYLITLFVAGKMDTMLAAGWRKSGFQWLIGPLAGSLLSDTFEAWVTDYGSVAPAQPVTDDAVVILDGDDDFRFRDVPLSSYRVTYVICQIG